MRDSNRTKSLSKISRELIDQGESEIHDFKRSIDAVSAEHLVSFANTDSGGTILVGIDEAQKPDGTQHGVIIGCDVDDKAMLRIFNKAIECIPPISVRLHIENLSSKPILRIEIPSSESKPHCTSKGIYCRRDGSRNRPLQPGELLAIFMEKEARAFTQRFEAAATNIRNQLFGLEDSLAKSIESIGNTMGWTESKLDETEGVIDLILAHVISIDSEATDISTRLRILFRQDRRDDPIRAKAREELFKSTLERLRRAPSLVAQLRAGDAVSFSAKGKASLDLDERDIRDVIGEAISMLTDDGHSKHYNLELKTPADASEQELGDFVSLVQTGGEVADGLRQRVERAQIIGFLNYKDNPIGTAALKRPAPRYRSGVFQKAKIENLATSHPIELGWVFLHPDHRGKGRIAKLLEAILATTHNVGVFATTRQSNVSMQKLLTRLKFAPHGVSYPSAQHEGEAISLYLRGPQAAT